MPRRSRTVPKYLKKYVNSAIHARQETKQRDTSWDATSIQDSARTPLSLGLVDIAQGDGQSERNGNQILVTGLYAQMVVTAADTSNIVRVVLYIPKDPDNIMSTVSYHSNIDQDQYTVLYDNLVCVGTNGGDICKKLIIKKSFTRNGRKGMRVQYSNNSSTSVEQNRLYLYVVGDSLAVSDPKLSGNIRTYYKDS